MPSEPRLPEPRLPESRPARSRRLDPDTRRGQLVNAGLELMKTIPFDRITPDEIARRAGVSKGLVFHYFAGKGDLQAAVLRATANELLAEISLGIALPGDGSATDATASGDAPVSGRGTAGPRSVAVGNNAPGAATGTAGHPALGGFDVGERLRAGLEAFVTYIEQRPENYLAISQRAGSDPRLLAVFEDTRSAIVSLIGAHFGMPDLTPGLRIVVRGWIALVEDSVLHWLEDGEPIPREALLGFLERAALAMLPDAIMSFPPALGPAAVDQAG